LKLPSEEFFMMDAEELLDALQNMKMKVKLQKNR